MITKIKNDLNSSHNNHNNIEIIDQFRPRYVPDFYHEPLEVGIVLDYVLVDWPASLYEMIRTREGRATLRRYAEDAQSYLENALNSVMSHDQFRYLIRSLWMLRSQHYYNGYDTQVPYYDIVTLWNIRIHILMMTGLN